jgi:hypothetical protein
MNLLSPRFKRCDSDVCIRQLRRERAWRLSPDDVLDCRPLGGRLMRREFFKTTGSVAGLTRRK